MALKAATNNNWTTLTPLSSQFPSWSMGCIGSVIWISTHFGDGESGMVQYCCDTDSIIRSIRYPYGFRPERHSVGVVEENMFVLADGTNGEVMTFEAAKGQYSGAVAIPKLGGGTSCINIQGYVHIMHGWYNANNDYLVYSIKTGKVKIFKDDSHPQNVGFVLLTKQEDDSVFYKFGGWSATTRNYVDWFYVGYLQNGDASKPIVWKKAPQYTLQKPLNGCGVIQKGPFIVIFGGYFCLHDEFLDDVFILDTRTDRGWTQSPIKCPLKRGYVAVLDEKDQIHLFTHRGHNRKHYRIPLMDVLPAIEKEWLLIAGYIRKWQESNPHTVFPKSLLPIIIKYYQGCDVNSEFVSFDLVTLNKKDDDINVGKEEEYTSLRKTNEHLVQKLKRMELDNQRLEVEVQRLTDKAVTYEDERKEAQLRIAALEKEVKELKLTALDASDFMEWNWESILYWILSLEKGRFKPFEKVLRHNLSEEKVQGSHPMDVEEGDVKGWGVKPFGDKKALVRHIRNLVEQHGGQGIAEAAAKADEGAPTMLI